MSSIDPFSHTKVGDLAYSEVYQTMYLLRHAKTRVDPLQHPRDWVLNREGEHQANNLVYNTNLHNISHIFSSPEIKAIQTVIPLADFLDVDIIEVDGLKEAHLDRYYETKDEFLMMKESKFLDPTLDIGESHEDALNRFSITLEGIRSYSADKDVLIVTHGTIMAIYLAYQADMTPQEAFIYWKNLPFCHLEQL